MSAQAAMTAAQNLCSPEQEQQAWVARRISDDHFCGLLTLHEHVDGRGWEISYMFTPTVWGRGFARECVDAVVGHALQELRLGHVLAETQADNATSRRLLERCGMTEVEHVLRFGAHQVLYSTDLAARD